jgi:uncharacterized protein
MYPLELLVLQLSPFCNLNCKYCYLSELSRRSTKLMSSETIARAVNHAKSYPILDRNFGILLHAGEPLGVPKALVLEVAKLTEETFSDQKKPLLLIQSNGTLIDQEWCDIFSEHNFRIGISIDGPEEIHNANRIRKNLTGSFNDVMNGLELLKKNNIEFNAISVLTKENINKPDIVYDFFKDLGCKVVGFSPEEKDGAHIESSLDAVNYQDIVGFFDRLFELWKADSRPLSFREMRHVSNFFHIENQGGRYLLDNQMNRPGRIISVSQDGLISTYSPELTALSDRFFYGNVYEDDFVSFMGSDALVKDDELIRSGIQKCKSECDIFEYCGGGTPSAKMSENGSFDSTFTEWCKRSRLAVIDGAISGLGR